MIVKLLTEHNLEFLSLKGDCRCSSESTYLKIPHCRESNALAHMAPSGQHGSCILQQKSVCNTTCNNTEMNNNMLFSRLVLSVFEVIILSKQF